MSALVHWVKVASLFLEYFAEIWIGDVPFFIAVKVLEHLFDFLKSVLYSHMIEALLELVEADTIVKVDVKVTVGLGEISVLLS